MSVCPSDPTVDASVPPAASAGHIPAVFLFPVPENICLKLLPRCGRRTVNHQAPNSRPAPTAASSGKAGAGGQNDAPAQPGHPQAVKPHALDTGPRVTRPGCSGPEEGGARPRSLRARGTHRDKSQNSRAGPTEVQPKGSRSLPRTWWQLPKKAPLLPFLAHST